MTSRGICLGMGVSLRKGEYFSFWTKMVRTKIKPALALLWGLRQSSGCCRLSCSSNCAPLCALCENNETNQNTPVVLQALAIANLPALLYPVVKFSHGDELTDILDDKRALLHFVVNSQTPATRCRSCHLKRKVNFKLLKLLLPDNWRRTP